MPNKEIKQNAKVAYSATFLRSIGWRDGGRKCSERGTVVFTSDDQLFLILWEDGHTSYVNKFNLVDVNQSGGLNADVETCKVRGYDGGYKKFD
jgi:hypothetical protein